MKGSARHPGHSYRYILIAIPGYIFRDPRFSRLFFVGGGGAAHCCEAKGDRFCVVLGSGAWHAVAAAAFTVGVSWL